jgi:Uma2 family endonuclease
MSQLAAGRPAYALFASFHRFSVDAYHRMLTTGILDEDGRTELLEGYLVTRMGYDPPHATSVVRTRRRIERLLPPGWEVREEKPVTFPDSEPVPDVAVARGDDAAYAARRPAPADLALLVEVADSSLEIDRQDKARVYARAGIAEYWIVNVPDRQIEVYTQPSGPASSAPAYAHVQIFRPGSVVPLVLDGVTLGTIAVDDVLP